MAVDWKLVIVNFAGVIYTILVITGIAVLNLSYTCPALYGDDNCGWSMFYAFFIIFEMTLNLVLFHYFNKRNQISYWRLKSASVPQNGISSSTSNNNSFDGGGISTARRAFTALNICAPTLSNVDSGTTTMMMMTASGNASENHNHRNQYGSPVRNGRQKSNYPSPPSIMETRGAVATRTSNSPTNSQFFHSPVSSPLIPTFEGLYRSEARNLPPSLSYALSANSDGSGGGDDGAGNYFGAATTVSAAEDSRPLLMNDGEFSASITTQDGAGASRQNGVALKFCAECGTSTSRRSHHCPLCGICVLRKDHHCFLTGGCVGLANQRYFIVFLFWASIGTLYGAFFNLSYLNQFAVVEWLPFNWIFYIGPTAIIRWIFGLETFFNTVLVVMLTISIASFCGAFGFLCAQMFYTLNGYTMHDYHVARLTDHLESDGENCGERLALVFGRRWWLNFLVPQFWLPNEMTPAIARNIFVSVSKDL